MLVNLRARVDTHASAGSSSTPNCSTRSIPRPTTSIIIYETRFPGEPADGVLDRNSRIVEPRQVRVGFKKSF